MIQKPDAGNEQRQHRKRDDTRQGFADINNKQTGQG